MDKQALEEAERLREVRYQKECDNIVVALLMDRGQHDLAKVMAMRAAGRTVTIGVITAEGKVIEVLDL